MATTAVEALGLLEPSVWTPLYPGFVYDPARFRSQLTEEGFVYDPVLRFGTEGFHYDEHGFRVETEEDVAYDIASFCARVSVLQGEAAALASRSGGDVEAEEEAGDDDDALEESFSHIIGLSEELLEDDDGAYFFPDETRGPSTS